MSIQDIRKVLKEKRDELLHKPNVVAVGVGYKVKNGKKTNDLAIICSVSRKIDKNDLYESDRIPQKIYEVVTDVIQTGEIKAIRLKRTDVIRPAFSGVSIGHKDITAGTFGCLVKKNGQKYILSNNHVMANCNDAEIGDPITQPGPYDGGSVSKHTIAHLSEFVPINYVGQTNSSCFLSKTLIRFLNFFSSLFGSYHRFNIERVQAEYNLIDAALAKPISDDLVSQDIFDVPGEICSWSTPFLGMKIKKSGRTTGVTYGTIDQVDVTTTVNYGGSRNAIFTDQLIAGPMSQGGDSGSVVIANDGTNNAIGLLFAGSEEVTVINDIRDVIEMLEIDFYE